MGSVKFTRPLAEFVPGFCGSFFGTFLAIAMNILFKFIDVLADVSMSNKLLSSA